MVSSSVIIKHPSISYLFFYDVTNLLVSEKAKASPSGTAHLSFGLTPSDALKSCRNTIVKMLLVVPIIMCHDDGVEGGKEIRFASRLPRGREEATRVWIRCLFDDEIGVLDEETLPRCLAGGITEKKRDSLGKKRKAINNLFRFAYFMTSSAPPLLGPGTLLTRRSNTGMGRTIYEREQAILGRSSADMWGRRDGILLVWWKYHSERNQYYCQGVALGVQMAPDRIALFSNAVISRLLTFLLVVYKLPSGVYQLSRTEAVLLLFPDPRRIVSPSKSQNDQAKWGHGEMERSPKRLCSQDSGRWAGKQERQTNLKCASQTASNTLEAAVGLHFETHWQGVDGGQDSIAAPETRVHDAGDGVCGTGTGTVGDIVYFVLVSPIEHRVVGKMGRDACVRAWQGHVAVSSAMGAASSGVVLDLRSVDSSEFTSNHTSPRAAFV
ncbi:uncharacterized protein MYCFIDRAFT_171624 [Pseudocercospora fijiensis CIRAD86]|uniref:Uncharacterized protein n=1 Tax=Pseudocercospora fijiensis (strain CIRAD86) TaxID=383855 RepID=M3AMG0_PSEFD|nr:uncharacterized protein MYCFIDRAFT_171624 [Pseudocercospora fijiensis CIRAD86]EME85746.1 hypothetical protein MYCFIDRAFT_171624 [Pseudocercospora fijiensis CIRAD86]